METKGISRIPLKQIHEHLKFLTKELLILQPIKSEVSYQLLIKSQRHITNTGEVLAEFWTNAQVLFH